MQPVGSVSNIPQQGVASVLSLGRLIFVCGPIAAGKFQVIEYARKHFSGRASVFFAHRYVAGDVPKRLPSDLYLPLSEYQMRERAKVFTVTWQRENVRYALGCEINHWLAKSADVVVHGSIRCWSEMMQRYPDMITLWVTASAECLRTRLYSRGVHDLHQIRRLLAQEDNLQPPEGPNVVKIINESQPEQAGKQVIRLLEQRTLGEQCQ